MFRGGRPPEIFFGQIEHATLIRYTNRYIIRSNMQPSSDTPSDTSENFSKIHHQRPSVRYRRELQ